jgi:hypothetical protein
LHGAVLLVSSSANAGPSTPLKYASLLMNEPWLRFEVSHPSDKYKNVARMGHPAVLLV